MSIPSLSPGSVADEQMLLMPHMLHRYLGNAGSFGLGLERTALRSESVQMRELLAYATSHGTLSINDLRVGILNGTISRYSIDLHWLGRLAHTVALQNRREGDDEFAIEALKLAEADLAKPGVSTRFLKLLAELLFEKRRFTELEELIARRVDIKAHYYNYISVDSRNPFIRGESYEADTSKWLDGFNRQFTRNDLTPLTLAPGEGTPFNRLRSLPQLGPEQKGPLVTVIMTSFKPEREDFIQSARSILQQTWTNLELIIVDDCSPAEFASVLDEAEALDPRVRVIRLEVNGGTYVARNVGITHAQGEFITGQDADDWSHPQRIQTQVNHLIRNPNRPGNQVYTVNMTEDLVRIRRGYSPFIPSAPTLMVRTEIMRELGGYLPARKAADNEMRDRVSAYSSSDVYQIPEPLIFMRILPESLSRADFRAGWQHPARRAFWSSYKTWHSTATAEQLRSESHHAGSMYVPTRFTTPPEDPVRLDVVFAADWCELGESQALALEEIRLLREAGYTVGVMHIENALHLAEFSRMYIQPVQQLISSGDVTSVLADEDFHHVGVVMIRTPELMEFIPDQGVSFTVDSAFMLADKRPWDNSDFTVHYIPENCARNAHAFFGVRPQWVSRSQLLLENLQTHIPDDEMWPTIHITALTPEAWRARRTGPRNVRPVMGRWAGDRENLWPESHETIAQIWPIDGTADVRLYGDPSAVLRVLGAKRLPPAWLSFRQHEISRLTYYRSLDFLVQFGRAAPNPHSDLSILEALATGCIAVLSPDYEHVYGDAAVYAEPQEVREKLQQLVSDRDMYLEQSRRGIEFASTYSAASYLTHIQELLRTSRKTEGASQQ
ncbi:glycosyltransferase [Nesterenkonia haasae]|uniref:glycosyltransferase n=1 Tax=Nesterenkonia haasae TaxID=2587813 RepID=UPI001391AAAA|nr:glycosyltransferase family 2 protein [Nesterenkonia haasae]NDK33180.1 glycosyltransferase [Nesterenkonia haasae]